MDTMVMRQSDKTIAPFRRAIQLSLGLFLVSALAEAADFEPAVTIGISYTDNLTLVPDNEIDETIYRVEPAFTFSHESPRLTVDADYLLQALRYQDSDDDEVYQEYLANITGAVIPEHVFLTAGTSRTQTIVDPEQRIPGNNLAVTGNRQDRDELFGGVAFRMPLSASVVASADARHSWLIYSDEETQDSEVTEANFSVDNYLEERGFAWAVKYEWDRTVYDEEGIPFEYQKATLEAGYWVAGGTRIFAAGGKETSWEMPLDPALEDSFWEVGVFRQIGQRLTAEFAAGERSFGSSWRGELDFEFQRGRTSLSYVEQPISESRLELRRGEYSVARDEVDFLTRPGSAERFISKRLQWSVDLEFQRTGLSFSIFDDERGDRTLPDGTRLADENQLGVRLMATYRVGARTELKATAAWSDREFEEGDSSVSIFATAGVDYQVGPRTTVTFEYQYNEEDAEFGLFGGDYVANTASLLLTRTF